MPAPPLIVTICPSTPPRCPTLLSGRASLQGAGGGWLVKGPVSYVLFWSDDGPGEEEVGGGDALDATET